MAINRTSFSAQDISENYSVAIRMVSTKPNPNETLTTPVEPNVMVGFYNSAINAVELFVADSSGTKYIKLM